MIKGITAGPFLTVSGGSPSTYVGNYNSGAQGVGNMRYNTSTQNMEVFDGSSWQILGSSYTQISLTSEAESLLNWARNKMIEEQSLKVRMEKHPGLKEAYERLEIMKALTLEEDNKHD